jgi:hypothetical protein
MRRILVAALATALTLLVASPASGVTPQREEVPWNLTVVVEELCGFPVQFSFEGTLEFTRFFDEQGNLTRIQLHRDEDATATNLSNGKTSTGHGVLNVFFDVEEGTEVVSGLPIHFNLPAHGAILMDAGKVVFDLETGEITFVAGPHQAIQGDFSEFCAALA